MASSRVRKLRFPTSQGCERKPFYERVCRRHKSRPSFFRVEKGHKIHSRPVEENMPAGRQRAFFFCPLCSFPSASFSLHTARRTLAHPSSTDTETTKMAKLGEGDDRWIVKERDDGRGWHSTR